MRITFGAKPPTIAYQEHFYRLSQRKQYFMALRYIVRRIPRTQAQVQLERPMEYLDLRFPIWQNPCRDAAQELDMQRLIVAEKAVQLRAHQIENLDDDDDEKLAINDALKSLRHFRGLVECVVLPANLDGQGLRV
jgi:hypothetical protein